ncbi:MAG: chemotaxis protein CheX [Gemmatimonadaceae bacterium]
MKALQEALEPTIIDIWSSLFSLDAVAEPTADLHATYVGCVHLAGAVSGTIVIECDALLARLVAARMFDVAQDEATEDDIRDAIGEITNIAAGNLKAALSAPTMQSLPTVVHGTEFGTHLPDSRLVASRTFSCGNDRFSVSVFEHIPSLRA